MNDHEGMQNEDQLENPTRRLLLQALGIAGISLACGAGQEVFAQEMPSRYDEENGGWFRSSEVMRETYDREYNGEKMLKNCFQIREGKIIGTRGGNEFAVPREFVDRILGHLAKMLEAGALKYIFRLDAFHGHPFLETQLLERRYDKTIIDELVGIKILLTDDDVRILYHNSEHLDLSDADPSSRAVFKKRNVIGGKTDEPLALLEIPTESKRTAVSTPENGSDLQASLRFAAHKDGAFAIKVGEKEIRLDLSLDDDTYY